jgi:integrase
VKGYIRQRGSSWELFVDFGRDQAGRRHRRTVTVKGTKREAEMRLRRMLAEVDAGLRSDPAKINVKAFLSDWLLHKPDLQPGSREKYAQIIEQHLIPTFGHLSFQQLRPDLIRAATCVGWRRGIERAWAAYLRRPFGNSTPSCAKHYRRR